MFGLFKKNTHTNYSSQNIAVNRENVRDELGNVFQRLTVEVVANPAVCTELEGILSAQVYSHLAQSKMAGKPTTLEEIGREYSIEHSNEEARVVRSNRLLQGDVQPSAT